MKSYEDAKDYFENVFAPERKKVILELINIRNDVQEIIKFHRCANIGCSYVGVLGGCAMLMALVVTGGAPVFAAGAFMGACSSYAEVSSELIGKTILITKFRNAETNLKEHEHSTSKMIELFGSLKDDINRICSLQSLIIFFQRFIIHEQTQALITSALFAFITTIIGTNRNSKYKLRNYFDIYSLVKLGKLVMVVCGSGGKGISLAGIHGLSLFVPKAITRKAGKKAVKVMTTAFGVVADFHSFITSVDDLANFDKGKLCTEAEKIDRIITELQWELKRMQECFENTST